MASVALVAIPASVIALDGSRGPSAAYADGPPPGHTGGFGEPTCHLCHFGQPLDAPGGSLIIEGVPTTYSPGGRYRITIAIVRPAIEGGGFQLATRYASGSVMGKQAGALQSVDSMTHVVRDAASQLEYLSHTRSGTALAAPDTARWILEWVAPSRSEAVVFHIAANGANGDDSPFGDVIDTASVHSLGKLSARFRED